MLFFLLPLISILYQSWQADWDNIQHLWQTVLTDYSINSLILVLGTVFLSLVFAIPPRGLSQLTNLSDKNIAMGALFAFSDASLFSRLSIH